jgi:hypothetical protein
MKRFRCGICGEYLGGFDPYSSAEPATLVKAHFFTHDTHNPRMLLQEQFERNTLQENELHTVDTSTGTRP